MWCTPYVDRSTLPAGCSTSIGGFSYVFLLLTTLDQWEDLIIQDEHHLNSTCASRSGRAAVGTSNIPRCSGDLAGFPHNPLRLLKHFADF
jgi:hypothetical protein